jgi:hypothetical protein
MMTLDEMKLFAEHTESEFWVLVLPVDNSDPNENLWPLIVATPEQMADTVDLKNLPVNMTLLKGEPARCFLIDKLREHAEWRAELRLKRAGGGLN